MYCTWEPEKTLKHHCSTLIELFKTRRTERDPMAISFIILKSIPMNISGNDTTNVDALAFAEEVCYARHVQDHATELETIRAIPPTCFFFSSMSAGGPASPWIGLWLNACQPYVFRQRKLIPFAGFGSKSTLSITCGKIKPFQKSVHATNASKEGGIVTAYSS